MRLILSTDGLEHQEAYTWRLICSGILSDSDSPMASFRQSIMNRRASKANKSIFEKRSFYCTPLRVPRTQLSYFHARRIDVCEHPTDRRGKIPRPSRSLALCYITKRVACVAPIECACQFYSRPSRSTLVLQIHLEASTAIARVTQDA